MTTKTNSKSLSTYISQNDVLGVKLSSNSVKYSIVQGGQFAYISDEGVLNCNLQWYSNC